MLDKSTLNVVALTKIINDMLQGMEPDIEAALREAHARKVDQGK